MVKTILYKWNPIALGTSIDFRKDLRRSEPRGDSGASGWRKEAVKTAGSIIAREKTCSQRTHRFPSRNTIERAHIDLSYYCRLLARPSRICE